MTKQELRKIFLEKRINLSTQEKSEGDNLLLKGLQHLPLSYAEILMSYFPIKEKNEPDTFLFSNYLQNKFPHLQIAYPKINVSTGEMQAILVDKETVYQKNNYKIMEPASGKIIAPKDIDIIFVPLVTCDSKGFRVGYGKGYYDRFLQNCRENAVKIGFHYFPPVEKIADVHEFDIPLNYCVTPDTIYEF